MDTKQPLRLASLPLLQGISALDISQLIMENVGTRELSLEDGERFVTQGDVCQHLAFLLDGTFRTTTDYPERSYNFTEYLSGPMVIEPDVLYGIQRQFVSTYEALGTCHLLLIPKSDVNRLLFSIEVFRLNYLNLLSTLSVRRRQASLPPPLPNLRARICQFFALHATTPSGTKQFRIRMSDMARYLDTTRARISVVLHEIQAERLIRIDRNFIEIPHLEDLTPTLPT
ncbi:MAG: Crp/Fnr family transcriptional regulator [Bacteroidaceae bacterium]|nr:Crp/Fnr family transcriptional regulator [Bacteroidaceae bacterium]